MKVLPKIQMPTEADINTAIVALGLDNVGYRIFSDAERSDINKLALTIMVTRKGVQ